jgi:hypothetical protein
VNLSEGLTEVAWVSFSGRFAIQAVSALLVPYSTAMAAVSVTNQAIFDMSSADLVISVTAIFGETGASPPQPILGHTAAGALMLPAPVDYVSWIEALGRAVGRPEFQAPEKVAFLSSRMSPLAQRNLTSRGWKVNETYTTAAER